MDITNDPAATPAQRIEALRAVAADEHFPSWVPESNNHIHTCFSFSPYTPTHAALLARRAGLRVVGSVDHDSIGAAAEMSEATSVLGMGSVTGFEIRARFGEGTPLAQRKLNNPDSVGVAYMTVQGVPAPARETVAAVARSQARRPPGAHPRDGRSAPTRSSPTWAWSPSTRSADMVGISQYANGGGITERHLLAAMASALIRGFGRGPALVQGLDSMGVEVPASLASVLSDADNPHLMYDLLGVLKANYLDRIYIQPTDELPSAAEVVAFADSVGAIATYAYLGDVSASPTGDKKAEKFEDDFLDELFEHMESIGLRAVTYMPPRNTPEQLARIHALAAAHGMLEISGVDINQPRQRFTCEELRRPEFADLNEATWALVAHEALSSVDPDLHLLGRTGRLSPEALAQRISAVRAPGARDRGRRGRRRTSPPEPHRSTDERVREKRDHHE